MQRKTFLSSCAATSSLGTLGIAAVPVESDYDLTTGTGEIAGTMLLPIATTHVPVVLIVAGSGPTDRNGNAPGLALDMYRKLARALAAAGIASVRFDKRGIGASRLAGGVESDIRFETYVADAVAWLAKIRADARFSKMTLIGHSEGSLIGMMAAARTRVDAFVALAGAGFPFETALRRQLADRLRPYPELAAANERIIASLVAGKAVAASDVPPELVALYRPSVQPYLMSEFGIDPRVQIARASGRVTIVQGTHDVQVPLADGDALAAARPDATYVRIDGMTHVLVPDPGTTLAEQLQGAYVDASRPLDATLVRTLVAAASA